MIKTIFSVLVLSLFTSVPNDLGMLPDCVDSMEDTGDTYKGDCDDEETLYKVKCKNGEAFKIYQCSENDYWYQKTGSFDTDFILKQDRDKSLKILCGCKD